jgi:hypothetical protein
MPNAIPPPAVLDYPRFGGKAPSRIEPVNLIDRPYLHVRRIIAFAQCRRDAGYHRRGDASDMSLGGAMNMTAENGNHAPGMLQSSAQPRHYLRCLEMKPVRPNGNFKWRVMRENRNWLFGLAIDQVNQMSDLLGRKVALCCLLNSAYQARSVLRGSRQSRSR